MEKEVYIVMLFDGLCEYPEKVFESTKEACEYVKEKSESKISSYPTRCIMPTKFKPKDI
ncbi:hypothetical protein vBBceHLY2_00076 [Bacillus phage vB_BceH_LY2]|nr:hypothetical protein vBBceHLY2_00076 [Bacillus phage vB_BceH_LY2]